MKIRTIMLLACTALALAGCATHEGGTRDEYSTGTGQGYSSFNEGGTMASPTFRPGMHPLDMRDSQGLTVPQPPTSTPPAPETVPPTP